MDIPQAKLPNVNLPIIRSIPTLPLGIGCAGADPTHYLGRSFGNLPNLQKLLHLKALKKALTEQIFALVQGQLPDPIRPTPYAARAAQLVSEISTIVTEITSVVEEVAGDIASAIAYVDEQAASLNSAKNLIVNTPQHLRDEAQTLMLDRYNRYIAELNAQKSRLQAAAECVTS